MPFMDILKKLNSGGDERGEGSGKRQLGFFKNIAEVPEFKMTPFPHQDIKGVEYQKKDIIYSICYLFLIGDILAIIGKLFYSAYYLEAKAVSSNIIYIIFSILLPFGVWAISTMRQYWCFYDRKLKFFYVCCIHGILMLIQLYYSYAYILVRGVLSRLTLSRVFTETMFMNFGFGLIIICVLVFSLLTYGGVLHKMRFDKIEADITAFKLNHYIDLRRDKEYKYDASYLNDLTTGKKIIVEENDRFTGTLVNGASGTGKTSMILSNSVNDDIDKKSRNMYLLEKELFNMACEGKLRLRYGDMNDIYYQENFNPLAFEPIDDEKSKKRYRKLIEKYPNCGVVMMAPNNGFVDEMIELCNAKGLGYWVVDPSVDENTGQEKPNSVGLNPFKVRKGLNIHSKEYVKEVTGSAIIFSDVMQAINEAEGKASDTYYVGINKSVTVGIATVLMVGVPLVNGRDANFRDLQKCVNSYGLLKVYVDAIKQEYEDNLSRTNNCDKTDKDEDVIDEGESTKKEGLDSGNGNPFAQTLTNVENELLGAGAEEMYSQARGLRNLINNFLSNPDIKEIFMKEDVVDFDELMERGGILMLNSVLKEGSVTSKGFGLFFLLLYKQAMFRRPKWTRVVNQFLYTDELPVYLHNEWEPMISLARQYRVGFTGVVQTLTQFNKYPTTAYLKDVFTSCGTQIVFGRAGVEDMRYYQELAGTSMQDAVRRTVSGNSMFEESTSRSESVMTENKSVENMEATNIRYRDFQEVTVYGIRNGRVSSVQEAKGYFLGEESYKKLEKANCDWKSIEDILTGQLKDNGKAEKQEDAVKVSFDFLEDEDDLMKMFGVEELERRERDGKYNEQARASDNSQKSDASGGETDERGRYDLSELAKYL